MSGGSVVAVCGGAAGLGIVGSVVALRGRPASAAVPNASSSTGRTRAGLSGLAAAGGGIIAAYATGWVVAAPLVALALYGVPVLLGRTSGRGAIATVEAVATWTEMLQGTLAASAGLGQAILATAPLAPVAIREPAVRLAGQLRAGVSPRDALVQFADEVGDPSADRVVCALLLASTSRAQRLGDLLAALAESTRDEVALRLRIETSRASVRSGVRTVVVFSVAFALGLFVLAHAYLAPFGTATGQIVLMMVGALYAAGLWLMVLLARPPAPIRLLGPDVVAR
jgi:tight adherence protein B